MTLKSVLIKGLLLALCASSSACVFNVQGNSNITFPIQNDGSLDMTAASVADVSNIKITGLFLQGASYFDVELLCESNFADGFYTSVEYKQNGVTNNLYSIAPSDFQTSIKTLCKLSNNGDETYELNLAVKVGSLHAPILGPNNVSCIAAKTIQEQKNLIQATAECVTQDSRTSSNALGLNTQVEPISKLRVILSEDYVHQL